MFFLARWSEVVKLDAHAPLRSGETLCEKSGIFKTLFAIFKYAKNFDTSNSKSAPRIELQTLIGNNEKF